MSGLGLPSRLSGRVLAVAVLLAGLPAGCGWFEEDEPDAAASPSASASATATAVPTIRKPRKTAATEDVDPRVALAQRTLDRRAAAVRSGDLDAFLRELWTEDPAFVAEQTQYFRNLQQLPLEVFRYTVGLDEWGKGAVDPAIADRAFLPQVELTTRLAGFDDRPVHRLVGFTFVGGGGELLIAADDDADDQLLAGLGTAPWDLVPIEVRRTPRALVVLDRQSRRRADDIVRALSQGLRTVDGAVPADWDGRVVLYAVGSPEVISSLGDIPGGNVAGVGALAFPVLSTPGQRAIASYRVVLNPSMLSAEPLALRRLLTHELSHVALRERDDKVPVWLTEGIAEWVSVQGLRPQQVRISEAVVRRAQRRGADALPASADFNAADSEWNYALSWWAAEWIARNRGSQALWSLLEAMREPRGGTDDAEQERILKREAGVYSRQLAVRAARLIVDTYT